MITLRTRGLGYLPPGMSSRQASRLQTQTAASVLRTDSVAGQAGAAPTTALSQRIVAAVKTAVSTPHVAQAIPNQGPCRAVLYGSETPGINPILVGDLATVLRDSHSVQQAYESCIDNGPEAFKKSLCDMGLNSYCPFWRKSWFLPVVGGVVVLGVAGLAIRKRRKARATS